jgi:hypothetical protein
MADLQPIKGFTALKFPRIDLDLDSARDHTFQERQKRDVRAIRCGLGGLESPREAPEKPDVADLQSSIDRLEEVSKFHPAQITALSARVSGLQTQARRHYYHRTPERCSICGALAAGAFCSSVGDWVSNSSSLDHVCEIA